MIGRSHIEQADMRVSGFVVALATCIWSAAAASQGTPTPAPEAPAVPTASTPSPGGQRAAYEANLTACVKRTKRCDPAGLSASDRNYLTYEMGGQRFSSRDAEEVIAVRMEGYDKPETIVVGRSTGHRHEGAGERSGRSNSATVTSSRSGAELVSAMARRGGCTVHVDGYTRRDGTSVRGYDRRSSRC